MGFHSCNTDVGICGTCAAEHCRVTIEDGAISIPCPAGCGHELNEQDIKKINPILAAPLEANRVAKRAEQLVDLFETSHDLLEWAADGNAQICPHCTTLVSKDGGCNHITCKCGGHFCYGCGMKMGECTCATGFTDVLLGRCASRLSRGSSRSAASARWPS